MLKATHAGMTLQAPAMGPADAPVSRAAGDDAIARVRSCALEADPEFRKFTGMDALSEAGGGGLAGPVNYLFAAEDDPHDPDAAFRRLRWGGQFIYVSRSRARLRGLADAFAQRNYDVIEPMGIARQGMFFGLALPLLTRKTYYFAARKVSLTLPKEISERFTYRLRLVPTPADDQSTSTIIGRAQEQSRHDTQTDYVVLKEVPSLERVVARLRHKFPDATGDLIEKRARKFTEKIFPLFLTREAAMLKILERDLPKAYTLRVPRVVALEQDARGYVRRMWMNWLRAGTPSGRPLTQMEFAKQSADMLRVMHDDVGVIHLDLRLDNVVITEHGVGFVDFGSAVRVGENIQGNPLLNTIFDELMRTSQIQRLLDRMTAGGMVTSHILNAANGKVDKAVDLFYLAMQMNNPLHNPDFRGLVTFDASSAESKGLEAITQDVLKPRDPQNPVIKSARDLLRAIDVLGLTLKGRR